MYRFLFSCSICNSPVYLESAYLLLALLELVLAKLLLFGVMILGGGRGTVAQQAGREEIQKLGIAFLHPLWGGLHRKAVVSWSGASGEREQRF